MITTTGVIVQDGSSGVPDVVAISTGVQHTFSAWVTVDASLAANSWLSHVSVNVGTSFASASQKICIEIGIGAASSEVTIFRHSFYLKYDTDYSGITTPVLIGLPIPRYMASGTRVAARISSDHDSSGYVFEVGVSYYQVLETTVDANVTKLLGTAWVAPATAGTPDVNVKNIANAVVNTATAQVGANVVSQDNIDFGTTQKASIGTAVETQLAAANTELATVPASTDGLRKMIQFNFEEARHKRAMNKDTGVDTLYKDDGSTPLGTATHLDDGTTVTRSEIT